jgi:uncharacterized membrane protein YczE
MSARVSLPPQLAPRLARVVAGVVIVGLGFSGILVAHLGVDPWNVLHQGISRHVGIPVGTVSIYVGLAVLLCWFPLHQRPGIGTVINAVGVGVVVDIVLAATTRPDNLPLRWGCLLAGTALVALGVSIYVGAGLGPGPRDGLMTGVAARGRSLRAARTTVELTALGTGWVLGGNVGVGTLVYAVMVGPAIHHLFPLLSPRSTTGRAEHGPAP